MEKLKQVTQTMLKIKQLILHLLILIFLSRTLTSRRSYVKVCFSQSKLVELRALLSFLSMEAEYLNRSFGWFLLAMAISTNTLDIYLIVANRHLCEKPNWIISSLATADFIVRLTYKWYFLVIRGFVTRKDRCWTYNSHIRHFAFMRLLLIWK